MFFDSLKLNNKEFQRLVKSDPAGLVRYIDLFVERRFYVGDTGINRKTIKDWEGNDLFPFKYYGDGWRKISFQEWIWIECIAELRSMGMAIEKIKEIKDELFENYEEESYEFLRAFIPAIKEDENTPTDLDYGDFENQIPDSEMKEVLNENQISIFLFILMQIVIANQNICIVYSNSKFFSFLVLGNENQKTRQLNNETFQELKNESFFLINLSKILNKLFQKPNLRHNDDFVIDFLSQKEKEILHKIRTSNAKEITINFEDGMPTHIVVHRNQITQEILNNVARLLKAGGYRNISFKERNGKIVSYNESTLTKLK